MLAHELTLRRRAAWKEAQAALGISKHDFMVATEYEFSDEQWFAWTTDNENSARSPSVDQMQFTMQCLDISMLWILHGLGPYRHSELIDLINERQTSAQQQGLNDVKATLTNVLAVLEQQTAQIEKLNSARQTRLGGQFRVVFDDE